MLDPISIIKVILLLYCYKSGILNTIPKTIFKYSVLATKEYSNTKIPYSFEPYCQLIRSIINPTFLLVKIPYRAHSSLIQQVDNVE